LQSLLFFESLRKRLRSRKTLELVFLFKVGQFADHLHRGIDSTHEAHVYTQIENFSNQVFWEFHEIAKKISPKINVKKAFFLQSVIRESRAT